MLIYNFGYVLFGSFSFRLRIVKGLKGFYVSKGIVEFEYLGSFSVILVRMNLKMLRLELGELIRRILKLFGGGMIGV